MLGRLPHLAVMLALAIAVALSGADSAMAKDKGAKNAGKQVSKDIGKGAKKVPPGQIKRNTNGSGVKPIPPGQIKRYTRGAKLPVDLDYVDIRDLSKWKLDPLKNGEKYIRVDNEVLRIAEDTQTVIDAVGIVDDLLR